MRSILILSFFLGTISSQAQWRELDIPLATRYDDVFFINENLGWAASGSVRSIYKTVDGGKTWESKFVTASYLRSIEFATENLGFAGTLNGELYRSTDGGENWTEITNLLPTSVPGICGLAAPSANVIYGCGKWSGNIPPIIIKTDDGGDTWTVTDMSELATQLVEVFFLDDNHGFAAGMANPRTDGGIILETTDGGENWSVLHKTMVERDYVWKIQTPDSVNFFGSVQSLPSTGDVRFVKSTDGAVSWTTETVTDAKWNYMQMVGFRDALNGWTGGTANPNEGSETALFITEDGGATWELSDETTSSFKTFNRFFMLDDDNIFLTGRGIYRFDPESVIEPDPLNAGDQVREHSLTVFPNPASDQVMVSVDLINRTSAWLEIFDESGKVVKEIYNGDLEAGKRNFSLTANALAAGKYFVVLHTNENMIYETLIIR